MHLPFGYSWKLNGMDHPFRITLSISQLVSPCRVMHICVSKRGHRWFRYRLVALRRKSIIWKKCYLLVSECKTLVKYNIFIRQLIWKYRWQNYCHFVLAPMCRYSHKCWEAIMHWRIHIRVTRLEWLKQVYVLMTRGVCKSWNLIKVK